MARSPPSAGFLSGASEGASHRRHLDTILRFD
jgi:hypothetical protein